MVKLVVIFTFLPIYFHVLNFFNESVFILQLKIFKLILVKFQVFIPWHFGMFSEIRFSLP